MAIKWRPPIFYDSTDDRNSRHYQLRNCTGEPLTICVYDVVFIKVKAKEMIHVVSNYPTGADCSAIPF